MHCTSCGTPLYPGMLHCPNCGAPTGYNTQTQTQQGVNNDSTIPAMKFGTFTEPASGPPNPPRNTPTPTPPPNLYNPGMQQGSPPANVYNTGTPPPYPTTGTPLYGYNAERTQYASPSQYAAASQYPSSLPPPQPQRQRARGLTIALIVLVLLILIGSGIIYYFSVPYPAQLHAQSTATAQTQLNDQATGTAQAIHNTNATATAVVQATLTAQQSIYTQATNGNPAITDALVQNSGLRWEQYDSANNGGCIFAGGSYHVKELQSGFFQTCMAQAANLSNFTLQVQMTILSGNFGGIIFRNNPSSPKFYLLQFNVDGEYNLYDYVSNNGNDAKLLLSGTTTAMKGLNQPNLLTLIAQGHQLTIFVNKQYVDTVNDGTYSAGQIGFMAYYKANPTEVAYSNMQVWTL